MLRTSLAFGIAATIIASAQSTQPAFEVASVKPASPDGIGSMDGGPLPPGPFNRGNHDPGRITWTNIRLIRVIQIAYDIPVDRISGPDWLHANAYNIVAIIPAGTSVGDFRLMLQHLLAERFKLAAHRETKEVSGYVLQIAKNGPKLKESSAATGSPSITPAKNEPGPANALMLTDASGFPAPRPGNPIYPPGTTFEATIAVNGRNRVTVLKERMPQIAYFLSLAAGAPVQDQTGLTGVYDFHLEYVPHPSSGTVATPDALPANASDPGPDLLDAVQSQLGLKLVPGKVPVETVVVDHAEKMPAAD